ncbi:hypothetical protein LIER_15370 [Lithospermum erythrorhizon]|uniref:Uncharacterized protein n=1 Tax=Lithospermum erythrorhizon TaxID=34254 RepID=A0AAV3Q6N5_LITER
MHGSLLRQREGEAHLRRTWHMPSPKSVSGHFLKDGRTICVGDCSLFKPPQDSPPFIGIIRGLIYDKENNLHLHVNWLYRQGDLKLGKGILSESALNEIFYSFHKDKVPAASLLHPCKVAFLPKGVELPPGTSAFVCRRVYDIESNRLWWLTDQDYVNELQEEVDQLLYKTRIEMHGTVPTGGRSPKPINGPTSISQLRPGSDSMQNHSHVKGKKRERGDHHNDPVKRESSVKMEDGSSCLLRTQSSLRSEIAKITEKGGLVDSEGVDKLVHLMQPDKLEKKMDLGYCSMLAGVIAATDKFDCLNRFVQLKGLPVLDEWLQNIHKGKTGNGSTLKDSDKFVEEFLLVLLSALDRLPVNLNALQMCNIGKSVNLLSKHKNLEIQKKAKTLVDTWKKRVEAEFNIMDANCGSNQSMGLSSKSCLPEASHGGNRVSVGSADMAAKSTVTQLSSPKSSLTKLSPGEATKSASSSSGPAKNASSPTSVKDTQHKTIVGGSYEVQPTTKDNRSSSSSQSHNYGQSPSGKEDAKSPIVGASSVKISRRSRHRKSASSGGQKESANKNSSLKRISTSEKNKHSELSTQKPLDPSALEGSIHKLIVKIPNVGRSPVRSAGGGSVEDHSALSGPATSPLHDGKHDQSDLNGKQRSDAYLEGSFSDVNVGSWRSNDSKDILPGPDNADLVSASLPHEDQTQNSIDVKKVAEISEASSGSSGNKLKPGTSHNRSTCSTFRSMNALIESCVKYSEVNTPLSIGDDVGMNLLASVAAGEMTKSDLVSPLDSPQRNSSAEEAQSADDARSKPSSGNGEHDLDDKNNVGSMTWPGDGHQAIYAPPGFDRAIKPSSSADCNGQMNKKVDEMKGLTSSLPANMEEKLGDGDRSRLLCEESASMCHGVCEDSSIKTCSSLIGDSNGILDEIRADMKVAISSSGCLLKDDTEQDVTETSDPGCCDNSESPSKLPGGVEVLSVQVSENDVGEENVAKPNFGNANISKSIVSECEQDKHAKDALAVGDQSMVRLDKAGTDPVRNSLESGDENKPNLECPQDDLGSVDVRELKVPSVEAEERECASMTEASSSGRGPGSNSKMSFDLNEGFILDDGRCGEQNFTTAPVCSSNMQIINPLPVTASTPITVAAAAKGPFVPPEDLLRSKRVLGWKGSAATSAFRPAEPRKILHASSGSSSISSADVSTNKSGRAPLGFDLNVPDEGILEEQVSRGLANGDQDIFRPDCCLGGFDLDLNRTDESSDVGICSASNGPGLEPLSVSAVTMKMGAIAVNDLRKDFDLNFGPCADETVADQSSSHQQARGGISTQPLIAGLRMNSAEIGNYCSGLPPSHSFSTVVHPSVLPDRVQHPIIASGAPASLLGPSGTPFTPDVFRGSVLSSSPAVSFTPNPFQIPVYPLGTTFPLPSASFSVGPSPFINPSTGGRFFPAPSSSQLMTPAEGISSQYPRPYIFSHHNGYGSAESKFGRQVLDLNAGLGSMDVEGRAEVLNVTSNRISMASSQSVAEEQAKIYQVGGRSLKRKEFDRGWDNDNFRTKRPS